MHPCQSRPALASCQAVAIGHADLCMRFSKLGRMRERTYLASGKSFVARQTLNRRLQPYRVTHCSTWVITRVSGSFILTAFGPRDALPMTPLPACQDIGRLSTRNHYSTLPDETHPNVSNGMIRAFAQNVALSIISALSVDRCREPCCLMTKTAGYVPTIVCLFT